LLLKQLGDGALDRRQGKHAQQLLVVLFLREIGAWAVRVFARE
jgi:hypothetical protein